MPTLQAPCHSELLALHEETTAVAISLTDPQLRMRLMQIAEQVRELSRSEAPLPGGDG